MVKLSNMELWALFRTKIFACGALVTMAGQRKAEELRRKQRRAAYKLFAMHALTVQIRMRRSRRMAKKVFALGAAAFAKRVHDWQAAGGDASSHPGMARVMQGIPQRPTAPGGVVRPPSAAAALGGMTRKKPKKKANPNVRKLHWDVLADVSGSLWSVAAPSEGADEAGDGADIAANPMDVAGLMTTLLDEFSTKPSAAKPTPVVKVAKPAKVAVIPANESKNAEIALSRVRVSVWLGHSPPSPLLCLYKGTNPRVVTSVDYNVPLIMDSSNAATTRCAMLCFATMSRRQAAKVSYK